ncbi:MAG: DUF4240 domain-containing protein [Saprospiraceae bacterium]|nr:MAG: DUF4240 domain-containing protein [Saprospiraceae bacterium]
MQVGQTSNIQNNHFMPTVMTVNVDDMDASFVEELKREYAHAAVEIKVQDRPYCAPSFTVDDFWKAIALLDWLQEGDDDRVVEPVVAYLVVQPLSHLYRFFDILAEKLWQLDTRAHAQVFLEDPDEEGYLSADDFLYARCAVVANGRAFYEKVLGNPAQMPKDLTFEPLLYIVPAAYQRKTGKPFAAPSAFCFETYSNKKGWAK